MRPPETPERKGLPSAAGSAILIKTFFGLTWAPNSLRFYRSGRRHYADVPDSQLFPSRDSAPHCLRIGRGVAEMKTDGALDQRPAKKRLASKWLHSPPSLRQAKTRSVPPGQQISSPSAKRLRTRRTGAIRARARWRATAEEIAVTPKGRDPRKNRSAEGASGIIPAQPSTFTREHRYRSTPAPCSKDRTPGLHPRWPLAFQPTRAHRRAQMVIEPETVWLSSIGVARLRVRLARSNRCAVPAAGHRE